MGDGMSFETTGFDDILKELNGLANSGDVADEMLKAAAPVLEKELKKQVNIGANRGYVSEGHELENSIKANAPKENSHGHFVSITAKGKNKKGTRYNEILAYLNYGTSRQAARNVVSKAPQKAEEECIEKMQEKFNELTGGE